MQLCMPNRPSDTCLHSLFIFFYTKEYMRYIVFKYRAMHHYRQIQYTSITHTYCTSVHFNEFVVLYVYYMEVLPYLRSLCSHGKMYVYIYTFT
jgi:hypothetical protein